jgi:glucose-1-phosphate adenylyltransferase
MPNCEIGRHSRIRKAIIDAGVRIPEGSVIGSSPDQDRANGYEVTDSGIVVVTSPPAKRLMAAT